MPSQQPLPFKVRDRRNKGWFYLDNEYLNGYARIFGAIGTAIYVSLCRHANGATQTCFPSQVRIAEELAIGERTVRNYLKRFENYRLIAVEHTRDQKTKRFLSSTYWLLDKTEWRPPATDSGGQPPANDDTSHRQMTTASHRQQLPDKETHSKEKKTQIKDTHLAASKAAWCDNKEIVKLLESFTEINPSLDYGHRTNRSAAAWLITRFGSEPAQRLAAYAVAVQGKPYAPVITTPYQLKEKLAQLRLYSQREADKKASKVFTL
ncbi:MAG: helix-turn-helix domain-containing protein [Chloroflexota bacterium]